jgi:DNA-binding HxlR family transcriptional regulator
MEKRDLKELFQVLGSMAAIEILTSIREGRNHYIDFVTFASVTSLNNRVRQLEHLGLIEHHLTHKEKRKEWYTITERGKRVLKIVEDLGNALQQI